MGRRKVTAVTRKKGTRELCLTADVAKTVRPSSFSQQGAQPACIQAPQPETPQAEGAVVVVQTQTSQQQYDRGSVSALHAHSQRLAEVLLVGATADQELQQLEGTAPLADLPAQEPGQVFGECVHTRVTSSDLVDERFTLGLCVDVGAQLDETLGHGRVSVLAGFLQHGVAQL